MTIGFLLNDIWITEENCQNCKITDQSYAVQSPSIGNNSYFDEIFDLDFAGNLYNDQVIIENQYKIPLFPLSVANKYVDILGLSNDGILGLGKDNSSVVYKMYEQGIIAKPIYSINYLGYPFIVLDEPNFLNLNLFVSSIINITIEKTEKMTLLMFNDTVINDQPCEVEFSTLSSYILGPFELLEPIFKILVNEGCYYEDEFLKCDCEREYPDLSFVIQGFTFSVPSANYLITVSFI